MQANRTEIIQARVTPAEAEKLNALTQRLGAPTISVTLRTLIQAASIESKFVLAIPLPTAMKEEGSHALQTA